MAISNQFQRDALSLVSRPSTLALVRTAAIITPLLPSIRLLTSLTPALRQVAPALSATYRLHAINGGERHA